MKNKIIMSKTIYILLKVLILTKADIMSKDPDSDSKQDIAVLDDNDLSFTTSHLDNVSVRKKINEIPFANMSLISEMKMQRNESILSKPTSPRAFVEFHNGFLNEEDISVTFRWNQPKFTDEVIQGYIMQYWFTENQKKIQICNDKNISTTILECTVHNLKPNTMYFFQVQANTKVGAGPYTDLIHVSTTHENPIPQLLIVSGERIDKWDLDSNININLVRDPFNMIIGATYSIAEHKIYWSNMNELKMLDINENKTTKIANHLAHYLCIDWVARNLYWMAREDDNPDTIVKFDLTMWENGITKYNEISEIKSYKTFVPLNVIPSRGILHWINYTMHNELQIIQSDLDGKNTRMLQTNLSVICPFLLNNFSLYDMKMDDINTKKPLIYWLTSNFFFVTDINVSTCTLILQAKKTDKIYFGSLTIDKTNIYISIFLSNHIYVLKKKYALLESVDAFKNIQKIKTSSEINELYAFGESLQPYPPIRCLTLDKKNYNIEVLMVTANSIIINLPEPVFKSGCKRYNLPTILYTINISYCLDNELNKFDNFTIRTCERLYVIQNLKPLTQYQLLLTLSNFYSDRLSMDPLFSPKVVLITEPSKVDLLDAPENVTVEALTPTIAAVYWMPPKKLNCVPVTYKVYWTSINLINNTQKISKFLLINKTEHKTDSTLIEPLVPGQEYRVYVRLYPANFTHHYNDSLNKTLYMYSEPNNIILNEISINSMNISWIPSVNLTINYVLEYKNVNIERQEWQIANNSKPNNEGEVMYYIKNLLPGTQYEFRLILKYPKYEKNFIWPSDGRFTFLTLSSNTSDISSSPGIYSDTQYIISSLVAMVIVIFICYYLYRRRNKNNKQVLSSIMTDTELAILQEMPDGLLVHFNMSYNPILQYDSDEYVLIRITREQIKLEKLLGSGAFGMVYQGKVKNLGRTGIEISAAVKMLRKNASSQERKMFLEEARLMKYFRHKHVLRLLAICLDPEIPSIVLELMETGDLLQYLRDSRKLQPSDSQALRLQDLFAICEDVARGCRYLEDLRFVHRDLACRNCLVSARDRQNRIVKIGDFRLSRDIYNSDYYRKKGQELLPIRWMAPESLVVGIFTSQSDVWSFGVIMWEITSLGEHPYTGRTNLEVIDYVRTGGRLPMPLNCPPTLYELMLRCWSSANDRLNFKLCLKNIIALRNNIEDTLLSSMDII